jgi:hypothetical protein
MVSGFLFALHFVAAVYAFVRWKKEGGLGEGLLAVAFVVIVFAVGWTIATMLTNLFFTPEFFVRWYYGQTSSHFLQTLRKEINRDTISLLLLTFGEVAFYYFYLRSEKEGSKTVEEGKKHIK